MHVKFAQTIHSGAECEYGALKFVLSSCTQLVLVFVSRKCESDKASRRTEQSTELI